MHSCLGLILSIILVKVVLKKLMKKNANNGIIMTPI